MQTDRLSGAAPYFCLLAAQSIVASFLFWVIFPVFLQMVWTLGQPQDLAFRLQFYVVAGALALQVLYWLRLRWVPVYAPFTNVAVGHVVGFGSRVSFFFGGALFSTIFFRHLPELDTFPPAGQNLVKGLAVMGVLFALYCYSRELESLGKAIEGEPFLRPGS